LRTYLKEHGVVLTRAQTWIGAQLPTEREALTLLMPRHVPLLIIHTLSVDASQRAFEYSVSLSRADQFQYHITSGELNEHTVWCRGVADSATPALDACHRPLAGRAGVL